MKGDVLEVGTDTIRSASALNIFRKGPIKAEIAGEWTSTHGGRRIRAFYGREGDGGWRGRVEDIGRVNYDEVSPYTLIRVLSDQEVTLGAVSEMAGEMNEQYLKAVVEDHQVYEDENYYQMVRQWLSEVLEMRREARANLAAGMRFYGIGATR